VLTFLRVVTTKQKGRSPSLGEAIRRRRESRNLSREKLAVLAGVSGNTLASIEGGGNPTLQVLSDVLRNLGVPDLHATIIDLLEGATRGKRSNRDDMNVARERMQSALIGIVVALRSLDNVDQVAADESWLAEVARMLPTLDDSQQRAVIETMLDNARKPASVGDTKKVRGRG
jgi:transcriptional regulator with XRE-family HTH domain